MPPQDAPRFWNAAGYPADKVSRILFEGAQTDTGDFSSEQKACLEVFRSIREVTQAPIFIQENSQVALINFGSRLKTCGYLFRDREGIIVSVSDRVPTRALFHELCHFKLRWVDKVPHLQLPRSAFGRAAQSLLNNELDHLEIVPREIEVFGKKAEKIWAKRWSDFPKNTGRQAWPTIAIRTLCATVALQPESRTKVAKTARRLGLQEKADSFAREMMKLRPDRSAMVRFALEAFEIKASGGMLQVESPNDGRPSIEFIS
ncbi:hypothetical protein [Leisingera methylohalidivorans]|uniref:Uncharacterized protein n=1 Tax=Leisingera methylohalidivorans DSM 14336 TaxID=999552 RepID=V9VYV6_9RHOB|nr:hypothetical protein [Leisingera methylohalidivorans]AHD02934.1 hypothetical protein METH_06735 [Leisingera methylohalidivorans DSM 14336]